MLEFGNNNRTQHPTDANAQSSRSHAVFQVNISIFRVCHNFVAEYKVNYSEEVDYLEVSLVV